MEGSLRQRGDAWQVRVYAGRDPVTGRKRWLTKTVRGGKREAQRERANLVAEVNRGVATGTDAGERPHRALARGGVARLVAFDPRTDQERIRTHIEPLLGPIKLKKLNAADLDRFYAELRKRPGRRPPTLSPATIRRVYVIIHAALEQAVKWGWIAVNPADASSPPKARQAEMAPPSPEGVARLMAMVEAVDPEFFTYLRVAVNSAGRRRPPRPRAVRYDAERLQPLRRCRRQGGRRRTRQDHGRGRCHGRQCSRLTRLRLLSLRGTNSAGSR